MHIFYYYYFFSYSSLLRFKWCEERNSLEPPPCFHSALYTATPPWRYSFCPNQGRILQKGILLQPISGTATSTTVLKPVGQLLQEVFSVMILLDRKK